MKYNLFSIFLFLIIVVLITFQYKALEKLEDTFYSMDITRDLTTNLAESGMLRNPIDKTDPVLLKRKIVISSYVNEVLASEVVDKLLFLDSMNQDTIDLYISTNGGWGSSAMSIIETMKILKSKVNTHILGYSYSSGALLLVSGTGKRIGYTNSMLSVHANLDSPDESKHDSLYQVWYEGIFRQHSNLPEDWYPMTRDLSYYMDSKEALKYNIIDTIIAN